MSHQIDVRHLGHERVICAYEVDGLVVDPGPASSVDALIEGLGDTQPRGLLLTHIHLDHAGATGVLVRRFPELQVYVHERGARHLVDPARLLASAERIYGKEMERLWGEVAPVPGANVRALAGGERVEGFRVEYVPGHAVHHVAYLHEETGDAYVGDMAGIRIPPSEHTYAPTPPPDIDVEAWLASLDRIEALEPRALCMTHFGRYEDVEAQLARIRAWLHRWGDPANEEAGQEAFERELRAETEAEAGPDAAATYFQAAPPEQLWWGLTRYWSRVREQSPP